METMKGYETIAPRKALSLLGHKVPRRLSGVREFLVQPGPEPRKFWLKTLRVGKRRAWGLKPAVDGWKLVDGHPVLGPALDFPLNGQGA